MFVISGANLKQWEQGRFLTNEHMAVGDAVQFTNGSGKSFTMYAYEKDNEIVVDVPNEMLKWSGILTADLIGKDGCKTRFEVEACEKPSGWKLDNNADQMIPVKMVKKDRPFYHEKTEAVVEVFPEATVTAITEGEVSGSMFPFESFVPIGGKTYVVNWNGITYERKAGVVPNFEENVDLVYIGNMKWMGMEDTGEPFSIVNIGNETIMGIDFNYTTEITLSIKCKDVVEEIKKLPSEFISGGGGGVVDIDLKAKGMPRIPLDGTPATITNAELVKELVECAENGKTIRVFLEGGDEYMTLGFFVTGIVNKIIDVSGGTGYNLSVMMLLEGMPFFVAVGFDNTEMIACNVMIMGA